MRNRTRDGRNSFGICLLCLIALGLMLAACPAQEEPGVPFISDEAREEEIPTRVTPALADDVDLQAVEADEGERPVLVGALGAERVDVLASYLSTGYDIYSAQGEEIGEAENFLFDTETGNILYLLVEYGGYAGIGATTIPVPLNALEWHGQEQLVLRVPEEYLEGLNEVPADWPTEEDESWDEDIRLFWAELGVESIPRAEDVADVRRYSALFTVAAQGEESGGVIADLVIDLIHGRVKYALLDFNEQTWRVVPWSAIEEATDYLAFDPDLNAERLEAAPRVPTDLPSVHTEPEWDDEIVLYWNAAGFTVEDLIEE